MWEKVVESLELLPQYLSAHLTLTLAALAVGLLISMPLALAVIRWPVWQGPVLAVASIIQTIPSLALLALMVPLLGQIGWVPAFIALTAYSVLPILRNTVTGIQSLDPAILEAARGVGMRNWQMLLRVQLPLAAPMILAGVRTATVWVVGIATLSTPVGATSLGNYIFSGLQTQNHAAVLVGCIAAAALALMLDGGIRLLEIAVGRRSRKLTVAVTLLIIGLLTLGLLPSQWQGVGSHGKPMVRLGSKAFTEQYLLTQLIAQRLETVGFATTQRESLGSMVIFDALRLGEIDCYVDYTGTIWFNLMNRTEVASAEQVQAEVTTWLRETYGIEAIGSLGFENAYAFAMRREQAEALGIRTIEDLARHSQDLTLGGDFEFFDRPDWRAVQTVYNLSFLRQTQFDPTLMYEAVRTEAVDVISAFSTDARIEAFDLLVLEDPREAFPPYDALLMVNREAAQQPQLISTLLPLIGAIDEPTMRSANRRVDIDSQSPRAASRWLYDQINW